MKTVFPGYIIWTTTSTDIPKHKRLDASAIGSPDIKDQVSRTIKHKTTHKIPTNLVSIFCNVNPMQMQSIFVRSCLPKKLYRLFPVNHPTKRFGTTWQLKRINRIPLVPWRICKQFRQNGADQGPLIYNSCTFFADQAKSTTLAWQTTTTGNSHPSGI